MDPHSSAGIGCRIIGEFDEDAAAFVGAGEEPVPLGPAPLAYSVIPSGQGTGPLLPPSEGALTATRKFWLKIIRRFMEPVPGHRDRFRVRDAEEPNRGRIRIEYGRCYTDGATSGLMRRHEDSGHELDVSDKLCLGLFGNDGPVGGEGGKGAYVRERTVPIPWTEVVHIEFEVYRPVGTMPNAKAKA